MKNVAHDAVQTLRRVLPMGGASPTGDDRERWRSVTVSKPPEEVRPEALGPLRALGDSVEVRVSPAPGDKGTEVSARLRSDGASVQDVRSALRQAKQLLETGEVLEANVNTTTKDTLTGKPLDAAISRAGAEGRL